MPFLYYVGKCTQITIIEIRKYKYQKQIKTKGYESIKKKILQHKNCGWKSGYRKVIRRIHVSVIIKVKTNYKVFGMFEKQYCPNVNFW